MKATGIVRRIDDRGKVVVPKEIRRVLGLKDDDEVLITVDPTVGATIAKYYPESATRGIIAYMDDLGRVTIPDSVQELLNITEGTPLEIFMNDTLSVTFVKYGECEDEEEIVTPEVDVHQEPFCIDKEHLDILDEDDFIEVSEVESDLSVLLNAMQMSIKTDASVFELFNFIDNFDKDVIVQALAIFLHGRRERCKTLIKDHPRLKGK